jgi:hypothetical protein
MMRMTAGEAFSSISGSGDDFAQVVGLCERFGDYCLIDGLAVNAYVEPVYTMDADFVLSAGQLPPLQAALAQAGFTMEEFPHSLNALRTGSQLRIQFTRDERYKSFPSRAERREILGRSVRVASLADLVRGKVWAWSDPQRRLSKRKKDELDLIRIAEKFPEQMPQLPPSIREQMGK